MTPSLILKLLSLHSVILSSMQPYCHALVCDWSELNCIILC